MPRFGDRSTDSTICPKDLSVVHTGRMRTTPSSMLSPSKSRTISPCYGYSDHNIPSRRGFRSKLLESPGHHTEVEDTNARPTTSGKGPKDSQCKGGDGANGISMLPFCHPERWRQGLVCNGLSLGDGTTSARAMTIVARPTVRRSPVPLRLTKVTRWAGERNIFST